MRTFWSIAFINLFLATVYLASALWVTFNPASGCTVSGVACNAVGTGAMLLYIGGPALVLMGSVLIGARMRRDHPFAALAVVAVPLLLLVALVLAM
jgi:hypothetical protein